MALKCKRCGLVLADYYDSDSDSTELHEMTPEEAMTQLLDDIEKKKTSIGLKVKFQRGSGRAPINSEYVNTRMVGAGYTPHEEWRVLTHDDNHMLDDDFMYEIRRYTKKTNEKTRDIMIIIRSMAWTGDEEITWRPIAHWHSYVPEPTYVYDEDFNHTRDARAHRGAGARGKKHHSTVRASMPG